MVKNTCLELSSSPPPFQLAVIKRDREIKHTEILDSTREKEEEVQEWNEEVKECDKEDVMSHGTIEGQGSVVITDDLAKLSSQTNPKSIESNVASNDSQNHNAPLSNTGVVMTSLTAGAIAGAAAKTTIAPLDRTKINFQISEKPYSVKEAIKFLVRTYQQEGLLSLWRGNSATMARIIPYSAIQFTAHEQWKRLLHIDTDKNKKTSPQLRFLAGSLAGVTSQSLTYPLDLARARMAVTHKEKYGTLKEVFVKTWIEEGPRAFYRGYLPTVLGVIPYAGVSFFTYDTLKKRYIDYTGNPTLNPAASLLFGAAAGMLGQSSSYPLDIVRRRMQTSPLTGTHYRTILSTLRKVYRDEGIRRGFFKGLSMNWVKGPVAVGISFTTYDILKDFLRLSIIYRR
uniref:Mitochondrial coenzyme A transporter SLC25A42 n=1 Tax=Timema bartmani TaxID=61472 RepID=A0A7R9I5X8_9NEOP|nr:unnamed protein product [Timema bartmani]